MYSKYNFSAKYITLHILHTGLIVITVNLITFVIQPTGAFFTDLNYFKRINQYVVQIVILIQTLVGAWVSPLFSRPSVS